MKPFYCILATLIFFTSAPAFAGQVRTKDEAIKIATDAIHSFHLTTLKDECGAVAVIEKPSYFLLVVRERHTKNCGGTPETSPRLFNMRVSKQDGKVTSDVYDGTSYRAVDHEPVPAS